MKMGNLTYFSLSSLALRIELNFLFALYNKSRIRLNGFGITSLKIYSTSN